MRLNRSTLYAIAAILQLADHKGPDRLACSQICRPKNLPENYVLQILSNLVGAGVIASVRGKGGGYQLAKPINEISILEIIEAVDELPWFNVETLDVLPAAAQRSLKAAMASVDQDMRKRLGAFTLDKLNR